jgi:hypothetical protein
MRTDTGLDGREQTNANNGEADHLELIRRLLHQYGKVAESQFDYHDFGFPRDAVRHHIANVEAEIRRLQASGNGALGIPDEILQGEIRDVWNSKKNLRYAAGAIMISSRFRKEVRPENRVRAMRLKILYEALVDTIDDVIDSGDYSFADALDLMRHCLRSLTASTFDPEWFREELFARLSPEHRPLTDLLAALSVAFREQFRASPHGRSLVGELDRFQENWILGEAYTMYQKDPTLDVNAFVAAGSHFPCPDSDLSGWERISGWISHTAAVTLFDLCYADSMMSPEAFEAHLSAWFYFDAVVTMLNNVMDLWPDIERGIANIFLIARGGEEVRELRQARGYRPTLSMKDYEAFLARTAELARRNLAYARTSCEDADFFYPFLAVMGPIVMFADETGIREDMLHAYLRALAPLMRQELATRPTPIPTIPLGTRSGRTRSARTASS